MKNPLIEEIKRFIGSIPPFNMLTEKDLELLASSIKVSYYPRRSFIFTSKLKHPLDRVFIILKGSIRLIDPKTDEVVELLTPGDVFGVTSFLMRAPPFLNAEALEDAILYEIPREVMERIFESNEEVRKFFFQALRNRAMKAATVRIERPLYPLSECRIRDIPLKRPVVCSLKETVKEAIQKMYFNGVSSIVVVNDDYPIGIITDSDVKRIVASGMSVDSRVDAVMSSPVWTIDIDSSCLDAYMKMLKYNVKHLVVLEGKKLKGIVTMRDLILQEFYNPYYIMKDVEKADTMEDLARVKGMLEELAQQLLNRGLEFHHITYFITHVTDKLIAKVIEMAGIPISGGFSFIGFGSLGRKELTIESDVDSGIIYDERLEDREKILELGRRSIEMLRKIGYLRCEGGFSADNPKWCRTIEDWEGFFDRLTKSPKEINILLLNILLDFRNVYGNEEFVKRLRSRVLSWVKERPPIILLLAKEVFGARLNADLSSLTSEKVKDLLKPVFSGIRLLSLAEGIGETSTVERILKLHERGVLTEEERDEIMYSYDYLSRLRLKLQFEELGAGTRVEESERRLRRALVRESVKSIRKLQDIIEGYLLNKYGVSREWVLSYG